MRGSGRALRGGGMSMLRGHRRERGANISLHHGTYSDANTRICNKHTSCPLLPYRLRPPYVRHQAHRHAGLLRALQPHHRGQRGGQPGGHTPVHRCGGGLPRGVGVGAGAGVGGEGDRWCVFAVPCTRDAEGKRAAARAWAV